jgi:hypothetical protein
MAKEKAPKAPRVTQKMLMVLTPQELRSLCVFLRLVPEGTTKVWTSSPKELAEYIIGDLRKLVEADLSKFSWEKHRTPTRQFVHDLQNYILAGGEAPVYQGGLDEESPPQIKADYEETPLWQEEEEVLDEDVAMEAEKAPVQPIAPSAVTEVPMPTEAAPVAKTPRKFSGPGLGGARSKAVEPVQEPVVPAAENNHAEKLAEFLAKLSEQNELLLGRVAALTERVEKLQADVVDNYNMSVDLSSGIKFIVNQAFVGEGEEPVTSLSELEGVV